MSFYIRNKQCEVLTTPVSSPDSLHFQFIQYNIREQKLLRRLCCSFFARVPARLTHSHDFSSASAHEISERIVESQASSQVYRDHSHVPYLPPSAHSEC